MSQNETRLRLVFWVLVNHRPINAE